MKKLALLALLICVGVVGCENKDTPKTGSGAGSAAPTTTSTAS